MKFLSRFCWLFVGALFIFSGLIKLNDPVGTAIKLEEYFEVFAADFSPVFLVLEPYALFFSILLSALEVILGVALLVRWRLKTVLWSLLAMIIFFTFLTFYSAYFNKVTDCGCFGDAIKLTPWQSFSKDVILLVMILVLLVWRQYLPVSRKGSLTPAIAVALTTLFAFGIGIYAYRHEPFLDFRAYKVGNSIPQLMKPSAALRYKYVMEKNGQLQEFTEYPKDTTYKFREMVALNPEAGPRITDFSVWNDEGDFTQQVFQGNRLLILVQDVRKANAASFKEINELVAAVERSGNNITPLVLTASSSQDFDVFRHEVNLAVPYYFADATVLKTMMRGVPGIMLLKQGVVVGKWHHNDVPTVETLNKRL